MKLEAKLFLYGVGFYAVLGLAYWFIARDPAGTTALALTAGLAALIGFYALVTSRRVGERPEDRVDAEVDEAAGELGFFSPKSWYPLAVALAASVLSLGVVFGYWLMFIGIVLLGLSVTGMIFEYYRGEHAH